MGVAGEPAVVVDVNAVEDVGVGVRGGEDLVAPMLGERAGQVSVVGVGDEVVAGCGL